MQKAKSNQPNTMASENPEAILFFDGICGLCNHAVDFLLPRSCDNLKFSPLQGETAKKLLPQDVQNQVSTMIYWENNSFYGEAEAYFLLIKHLKYPWRIAIIFRVLPNFIVNFFYRWIGRNRYQIFGQREACRIPSPSESHRFLK